MISHAQQFVDSNTPFIFDPGQGMPMFDGKELNEFIEQATWVTVNDYEWQMMKDKTGFEEKEIAERVSALIITYGGNGSKIHTKDRTIEIPAVTPEAVVDPTGCGDAFRGGLLFGLINDMDLETTGRIASMMGSKKISCHGTQNHSFTLEEFRSYFKDEYDYEF